MHRTGSAIAGRVGEAAFFLSLFLIGVGGIIGLSWSYATRSWPVADMFPSVYLRPAEAVVKATRVVASPEDETQFTPEVLIEFQVAESRATLWAPASGEQDSREQAKDVLDAFPVEGQTTCWYDPQHPTATTLQPRWAWGLWLIGVLLLVLGSFGGYGIISAALQVGASAERRAALAKAAASRIELDEDKLPSLRDFPSVPRDVNLYNSPGVKLKYRLPANQEPVWRLFGSAIWMLTCTALGVALAVVATEQILSGRAAWLLGGFAVCVAALAAWSIYSFLQELVASTWMGATSVEISKLPLQPGDACDVYLTQAGNLQVTLLRLLIVCDEETTFLQGTDIRHDRQRVYCDEIIRRQQIALDASQPIEEHCPLRIPASAMHSFKSRHNAVQWKLVVEIKSDDWPTYVRTFPFVVYPSRDRETLPENQA